MASGDNLSDMQSVLRELLTDLRDHILTQPAEQIDLFFINLFFQRFTADEIMHHMIEKLLPYERMITNRDENFFLHHDVLFEELPENRCIHYRNLWVSNRLSAEDKNAMWEYFETMIEIIRGFKKII